MLGLLGMLLGGCAAPVDDAPAPKTGTGRTWRVVLDATMTDYERETSLAGLEAWRAAVPCPMAFVIEDADVREGERARFVEPSPGSIALRIERQIPGDPDGAVGQTNWVWNYDEGPFGRDEPHVFSGAFITMHPAIDDLDDFPRVVRHELGHAFGLGHRHDGKSIMSAPPTFDSTIYPVDAAEYAARWCR